MYSKHVLAFFICLHLIGASQVARADAGHKHGASSGMGAPGKSSNVDRTISIEMNEFGYHPHSIDVRADETVRFVVSNRGQLVHEFNIGTSQMHEAHQAEMLKMMRSGSMSQTEIHAHAGMAHDHANSILLNPGESGELIWRFGENVDTLQFACDVPGHYEAGMVGAFNRR